MSGVELIKAENVEQNFRVGNELIHVLKNVNFTINDNTFNIIFGPSGSGKSTLLNLLSGLLEPTNGTVTFNNENVYKFKPDELAKFRAHRIGFVYQQNHWIKSLNVVENLCVPLFFLGYGIDKARPIAMHALEQVHMEAYAKKDPVLLSGGEQQRIALARAIVNDPMFIIADEPTGNLDSTNGDRIMELLQYCKDHLKRTVILVTHNMEYLPLADHLLRISDGQVVDMSKDIEKTATELLIEMGDRIKKLSKGMASKK